MGNLIEDIRQTELRDIKYNEQSEDYVGYIKGRIPILISAPHGAKHYRTKENRWKAEDAYTGALAIELGRMTGAHVMFTKNKTVEDPNSDRTCRYKDLLKKVVEENGIKFVVDLHGTAWDEPFKIDVGTISNSLKHSSCPTYRPLILNAFSGFDKEIFNKRFRAQAPGTITCFARNDLGIEAAQIEINARYRMIQGRSVHSFRAREEDVLDLVGRLERLILDIETKIAAGS